MTLYGNIDLGQHWSRKWLVAWRHQAITWTSADIISDVLGHLPESNFKPTLPATFLFDKLKFENQMFRIADTYPMGQWVKPTFPTLDLRTHNHNGFHIVWLIRSPDQETTEWVTVAIFPTSGDVLSRSSRHNHTWPWVQGRCDRRAYG